MTAPPPRCLKCRRPLRHPDAIARGLGPTCALALLTPALARHLAAA